jgi:hypothetical protein
MYSSPDYLISASLLVSTVGMAHYISTELSLNIDTDAQSVTGPNRADYYSSDVADSTARRWCCDSPEPLIARNTE